jgi:hypothetical protein
MPLKPTLPDTSFSLFYSKLSLNFIAKVFDELGWSLGVCRICELLDNRSELVRYYRTVKLRPSHLFGRDAMLDAMYSLVYGLHATMESWTSEELWKVSCSVGFGR